MWEYLVVGVKEWQCLVILLCNVVKVYGEVDEEVVIVLDNDGEGIVQVELVGVVGGDSLVELIDMLRVVMVGEFNFMDFKEVVRKFEMGD